MQVDESRLPPHLYLSGGWKKPRSNGVMGPMEEFSSTMLDKFECLRAGAFSYILGIKEHFRADTAAGYGVKMHGMLDQVWDGQPLPLESPDPLTRWLAQTAFAALAFVPRADQIADLRRESTEWLDTRYICPDIEPLRIQIKQDLSFLMRPELGGGAFTYDYKFITKWERAKSQEDLWLDTQGVLYPTHTMIRWQTTSVGAGWIYALMDPEKLPEARPVGMQMTWADRLPLAQQIVKQADRVRNLIRLRVHPNDLPPNPKCCLRYYSSTKNTGGCPYRPEVGGPCSYDSPKRQVFGKVTNYMTTAPSFPAVPAFPAAQPAPQAQPPVPAHFPALPPTHAYWFDFAKNDWTCVEVPAAASPAPAVPAPPAMPATPITPPEAVAPVLPQPAPAAAPVVPAAAPVVPQAAAPAVPQAPAGEAPKKRGRKSNAAKAAEEAAAAHVPSSNPVAPAAVPPPVLAAVVASESNDGPSAIVGVRIEVVYASGHTISTLVHNEKSRLVIAEMATDEVLDLLNANKAA